MTSHPHPRRAPLLIVALLVALAGCASPDPVRGGPPEPAAPTTTTTTTATTGPTPVADVTSAAPKAPTISYRTERKRQSVSFRSRTRSTNELDRGVTKVSRAGRVGLRVVVYRIKLRNGIPVGRERVRIETVRRPVDRLVLRGTHVDPPPEPDPAPEPDDDCDPNYSGACVPTDSDVDCAGGSGNGPSYVGGPVTVVGNDIYGLDANNDGYGCE
ncbi:G5 domain-containing protein [Nocardioides plantarum]|uniref:G5 domain-containing protein n=1 Tax=Nocardioides plantarum TaxID=29299 RepID=A0ABV5KA88_9ACTN|nr:G5 domain-containing protein [Nocardioides plantarum]